MSRMVGFSIASTSGDCGTRTGNGPWVGPLASSPLPLSPDGSVLQGGDGGSLQTTAGTWTFAPTQNSDGNWSSQLNGANQGVPEAVTLYVENSGILYSVNVWEQW